MTAPIKRKSVWRPFVIAAIVVLAVVTFYQIYSRIP